MKIRIKEFKEWDFDDVNDDHYDDDDDDGNYNHHLK